MSEPEDGGVQPQPGIPGFLVADRADFERRTAPNPSKEGQINADPGGVGWTTLPGMAFDQGTCWFSAGVLRESARSAVRFRGDYPRLCRNHQKPKQLTADEDQGRGLGSRPKGATKTSKSTVGKPTRSRAITGLRPKRPALPWVACAGRQAARQLSAVPLSTTKPEPPSLVAVKNFFHSVGCSNPLSHPAAVSYPFDFWLVPMGGPGRLTAPA